MPGKAKRRAKKRELRNFLRGTGRPAGKRERRAAAGFGQSRKVQVTRGKNRSRRGRRFG